MRLSKRLTGAAHAARELRNELAAIEAFRCDSSAAQVAPPCQLAWHCSASRLLAHGTLLDSRTLASAPIPLIALLTSSAQAAFLTGGSAKYASKALRRAGACGAGTDLLTDLVSDTRRVGEALRSDLARDALEAVQRVAAARGEGALCSAAAALVPPMGAEEVRHLLDARGASEVLELAESTAASLDVDEARELLQRLRALVHALEPASESYCSLLTQREQLAEWADCAPRVAQEASSEYESLMFVGMLGYPIQVRRGAATQMDPFAMTISSVLPSPVDSASLLCSLQVGARH